MYCAKERKQRIAVVPNEDLLQNRERERERERQRERERERELELELENFILQGL